MILMSFSLHYYRSLQCPHRIGCWRTGWSYNKCKGQHRSLRHFRCRSIFFRVTIVTFTVCVNILDILLTFSSINNKLGSRLTLLLGSIGYALYIGSFLQVSFFSQSYMAAFMIFFQCNEHTPPSRAICRYFWRHPRYLCGTSVDGTGFFNAGLSDREPERKIHWHFLGHI